MKWQPDAAAANALAFEIADATLRLLATLEAARPPHGPLLQSGLGLNVNIPQVPDGQIKTLPFRMTRLGTATDYGAVFFEKLAAHPLAAARGVKEGDSGIAMVKGGAALPNGRTYPRDTDPLSENNVLDTRSAITVSPVEGIPEARSAWSDAVARKLAPLLNRPD